MENIQMKKLIKRNFYNITFIIANAVNSIIVVNNKADCSNFVVSTDFLFDFIYTFYCRESLRILYIQGLLALYLPAPAPLQALSLCMIN